jgi:RNA polymerase sigma-70 factor (ECF subfamily)
MNESNALLAQRFRQNDETAFTKLVGRHHSLVFRLCLKILGHRQDAEDATQETFSRLARYLDRWDSRRPLEPWLIAIAGNRCRTFLASRRVHQALSPALEPVSHQVGAERDADFLREELSRALSQLPDCQRRAFELFHEYSLSYAEIARRLECPIGTVKTWVHRARGHLIRQLRAREVLNDGSHGARAGRTRGEAAHQSLDRVDVDACEVDG